ncbi:muscle-specific protein 20 transgelin [Oratosquilla oratoria]|uniref:muscle-specific protein 20 transgelin n=1 Tax=Oratosquilla oratoria TaxID=337810 RepID=UPI003F757460
MALQRQVAAKMLGKRDKEQDAEAQAWIEAVLDEKFPEGVAYEDAIRDGQILCRLINTLAPGSIKKINTSGAQFKLMENINNFTDAIRKYGVPIVDLFQTIDLWEKKDIAQVTATIHALGRTTYKHPEWTGPCLGPRPAEENKREWTEEQLRAGEGTIGLQAGYNKGATQAGQNVGKSRSIILGK